MPLLANTHVFSKKNSNEKIKEREKKENKRKKIVGVPNANNALVQVDQSIQYLMYRE